MPGYEYWPSIVHFAFFDYTCIRGYSIITVILVVL